MDLIELEAQKKKLALERDIMRMEREKSFWAAWKYAKWGTIPLGLFVGFVLLQGIAR